MQWFVCGASERTSSSAACGWEGMRGCRSRPREVCGASAGPHLSLAYWRRHAGEVVGLPSN